MIILEGLSLLVLICLGVYASVSDIRNGIIKNRVLAAGALYAVFADGFYYGLWGRELAVIFFVNLAVISALALVLFFTRSWAGGDCKLLFVFALLYPAGKYFTYNGQTVTLVFAVFAAFLIGYIYLIADYIFAAVHKRTHLSGDYIKMMLLSFIKAYIQVLIYLTLVHLLYMVLFASRFEVNAMLWAAADFCMAWFISSSRQLRRRTACYTALAVDIVLSMYLHIVPIGTDMKRYLFLFAVILLKIILSEQTYQTIPTGQIRSGMILSTAASMQFLSSRVKGLPQISTEDLRCRLTEEEAESIRRWEHSAAGKPQITIVRKIPFAIFISLGFLAYFMLWMVI